MLLTVLWSAAVSWLLTWATSWFIGRIDDTPTSVIMQFVLTFAVWLLAERLGFSAVVTVVVFGLTSGQRSTAALSAHLRVPNFAVWDAVTFVLNVLAFTLIGLQLGPILESLEGPAFGQTLGASFFLLAVVILVRLVWALLYALVQRGKHTTSDPARASFTAKGGLVIGWSGMRGIVTLATALALPEDFPYRDFIQLTASVVVLGTLVIQGLTLRPLLLWLKLPTDDTVASKTNLARAKALKAVMQALDHDPTPAAARLREEYQAALLVVCDGGEMSALPDNALRREVLAHSRGTLDDLRRAGTIRDDAYRQVEVEVDVLELMAGTSTPAAAET